MAVRIGRVAPAALQQRAQFEGWLREHVQYSFWLAREDQPALRRSAYARLASLTGQQAAPEYVSVLMERRQGDDTPAYIGHSAAPLRQWAARLDGLALGEGPYARWRTRLLREGHQRARFDLRLYLVGSDDGAGLADQLRTLAAGAYPLPLLPEPAPGG